jgi:hypothetical protein
MVEVAFSAGLSARQKHPPIEDIEFAIACPFSLTIAGVVHAPDKSQ